MILQLEFAFTESFAGLQVLAVENPNVRVLSYAPGALSGTDMTKTILSTSNKHNTSQFFRDLKASGKFVTCKQSAAKLISLLRMDYYSNGDHVDYDDVKE